MEEAVLKPNY